MGILKESFVTNLPGFVLYWLHIDLEVVDYTDKIFIVFNMREKNTYDTNLWSMQILQDNSAS